MRSSRPWSGAGSGEPYLLEQLASAVAAAGGNVAETVPDTIRSALQARIDTLDENVRDGCAPPPYSPVTSPPRCSRPFSAMGRTRNSSPSSILVLVAAPGASGTYRFADPLLQDMAYGTVPKARRTVWHGRAAHWLERRDPDVHTVLAFHYAGAGDELGPATRWYEPATRPGPSPPTPPPFATTGRRSMPPAAPVGNRSSVLRWSARSERRSSAEAPTTGPVTLGAWARGNRRPLSGLAG